MDLIQITEMKNKITEELRQINGLKQSMEATLAGLIEWEKQLQSSVVPPVVKTPTRRPPAIQEIQPIQPPPVKAPEPTPSERVNKALAAIHGEFTRSQLLAQTEGDGKGDISTGTYSNIFSRLLKKERVQCVKGNPGQRDSLFMKSGEKKPDHAQGSLVTE
jgi:hypothetical protein